MLLFVFEVKKSRKSPLIRVFFEESTLFSKVDLTSLVHSPVASCSVISPHRSFLPPFSACSFPLSSLLFLVTSPWKGNDPAC